MLMGFLTLVNIQSRFLTNKNLSRDFRRIWKICSMCSDGPLSSTAIHLFRKAIERETGRVSKHRGYDGLVEDCKYLQKYRSPVEQRAAVCRIISSLFCAPVGIQLFRSLLVFFQWLVDSLKNRGVEVCVLTCAKYPPNNSLTIRLDFPLLWSPTMKLVLVK
ncbi:Beta-carotene isomerase D27, chloroplastic [Galdieria sulphuraria]|nr:Beta-carotene isomerase D27, chloroplastic [Galdieria sulphuraria]